MKIIECTHDNAPKDTPHENHSVGQTNEELGPQRVEAIVNSVLNRGTFNLFKYHNPDKEDTLTFDFSSCAGTVEDAIMAMVSVEKVFRMYRDPNAGEESRVMVDRKVDAFLKDHFIQYRSYCARTKDHPDQKEYIYYTHIKEDDQYDDLTLLGMRRK
jgi:hypothetical protein